MIELTYGQMITVLGMIGSGKTVFLQYLFSRYPRCVMFDVEDADNWENVTPRTVITHNLEDTKDLITEMSERRLQGHIVYKCDTPMGDGLTAQWDNLCLHMFNYTYWAVMTDEMGMINQLRPMDSQAPPHYANLLLRGRKRGVSVVVAAQRNQHIPKVQVTQSVHKFVFRMDGMELKTYLKSGLLGSDEKTIRGLEKYHCIHEHDGVIEILTPVPDLRSARNNPITLDGKDDDTQDTDNLNNPPTVTEDEDNNQGELNDE